MKVTKKKFADGGATYGAKPTTVEESSVDGAKHFTIKGGPTYEAKPTTIEGGSVYGAKPSTIEEALLSMQKRDIANTIGHQVYPAPNPAYFEPKYGAKPITIEEALLSMQKRNMANTIGQAYPARNPAYFDPKDEALENPLFSPEDLVALPADLAAKGVMRAGEAAAPYVKAGAKAIGRGAAALMEDESGNLGRKGVQALMPELPPEVPMYSKLEETVNSKIRQSMPSEYVKATLKNAGVTADELEVYGVDGFLKGKKTVTPEELKEFVKNNRPNIEKHSYGDKIEKFDDAGIPEDFEISDRDIARSWDNLEDKDDFDEAWMEYRDTLRSEHSDNPINRFKVEPVETRGGSTKYVLDLGDEEFTTGYGQRRKSHTGSLEFGTEDEAQSVLNDIIDNWEEGFELSDQDTANVAAPFIEAHGVQVRREAWERALEENPDLAPPAKSLPDGALKRAEAPLSGKTKYKNYTLEGGENYREDLFTGPSKTSFTAERAEKDFRSVVAKTEDSLTLKGVDTHSPEMAEYVDTLRDSAKVEDKEVVKAYDAVVPPWKRTAKLTISQKEAQLEELEGELDGINSGYEAKKDEILRDAVEASQESSVAQLETLDAQRDLAAELNRDKRVKLRKDTADLRLSLENISGEYKGSHFGNRQPNIFVHARTTERDLPGVGKSLHVEEIQSDGHQEARKVGYVGEAAKPYTGIVFGQEVQDAHLAKMQGQLDEYMRKHNLTDRTSALSQAEQAGVFNPQDMQKLADIQSYKLHQENPSGIPEMIMAKGWEDHGFKRSLQKAVDQDKDYLTWNTGEISARINSTPKEGHEGQKFAYDKKYPGIIKRLINQFDSSITVEKVRVGTEKGKTAEVWGIKLTPKLKNALRKKGFANFASGGMVGYANGGGVVGSQPGDNGTLIPYDAAPTDVIDPYTPDPIDQQSSDVNVITPEGDLVSIPQESLAQALQLGYSHAPQQQVENHFQQKKYGAAGQQAIAGLEGVASGVVGSTLATAAERGFGVNPADIRAREAANPGTHLAGEVVGFAGSALAGTGEAALLGKAGEAAASAVKLTGGWQKQVAQDVVKAAFEGVLYQGDQELGRVVKQDPEVGAGYAIVNIGLAGVMGGVFGGATGAALRKLGVHPELPSAQVDEGPFVSGMDMAAYEAGDLKTHVAVSTDIAPAKKEGLLSAFKLNKQKHNAKEIKEAAKTIGAPETPGMTLESPLIQMQLDSLAHSPYTYSGNKIRGQLDAAYSTAEGALEGATKSASGLSKEELGLSVQKSLTDQIKTAYAPVKTAFEEVSALHPNVPVELKSIGAFKEGLKDIKEIALGPSTDEGKLARQVISALQNAKTAEDIGIVRNMAALKKSGLGADPMGRIKGVLRDRLAEMQDDAVARYAKSFPRNDEAGALMGSLIDQNAAAKEAYKPYIRKVGELSEWLGKGKIHGTADALNFMNERLTATDISKRMFSAAKDPAFIKFFSKEFPEQFQLVRDHQRMALRDAATTGESFSPKVFFNKYNKLEPEIQRALYTVEEMRKIAASETYIRDAFPKNFNPSGTAHALALKSAYGSPKGLLLANARDYAMEKVINASSNIKTQQAQALAEATIKGDRLSTKAVKAIFNPMKDAMPSAVYPLAAHRDKLERIVAGYQADPSKMFGQNDSNPIPAYAQAFSGTTARAMSLLVAAKPGMVPRNPLDTIIPASKPQQAQYTRTLDIAQQPLSVLARIKNNTLVSADVVLLKTLYPTIYNGLSQKLMNTIIEMKGKGKVIPYNTRIQLSVFLGQPLDSTMTQPSIAAAQAKPLAQQQPQESAQTPKTGVRRNTGALEKLGTSYQTTSQGRVRDRSDGKL